MNELLLLLDEHIEFAAQEVDDLVKSKNPLIEALDKPAAKLVLNYLNKVASPHVPDEYKPKIQEALNDVVAASYADAVEDAIDVVEEIILDLESLKPGVKEIVIALLSMVSAALKSLLEKKQAA
jgi:hypothetical protein